jgi:1-acyl-sn-glycerol-3-phosphate acyltransferase
MAARPAVEAGASLVHRLREARPSSRLQSVDGGPRVSPEQRLMEVALRPLVGVLVHKDYRGLDHVPRTGGVIVAGNHLSDVDPFVLADFLTERGRHTHFLAKAEVFDVPLLGAFLRAALQIAVHRTSLMAGRSLVEAAATLHAGALIALYPEGEESLDPTYWPMYGRPGAAALAITTGAPVIPVVQWGTQDIRGARHALRLLPRATVTVVAGEPVDLSRWHGRPMTHEVLRQATDRIVTAIVELESKVRDQQPPDAVSAARPGFSPEEAERREEAAGL